MPAALGGGQGSAALIWKARTRKEVIRARTRTTARFILKYLSSRAPKFDVWLPCAGNELAIGLSKGRHFTMKLFSLRARCAWGASLLLALIGVQSGARAQDTGGQKVLVRTASFAPQVFSRGTDPTSPSVVQAERIRVQGILSKALPGTTLGRSFNYVGWSVAQMPTTVSYDGLARLQKALGAGNAEAIVKRYATRIPNDPQFGQQYWLSKINAPTAWNTTTGSSSVIVAVIDTGAQLSHPDLRDNLYKNSDGTIGFNAPAPGTPPEDMEDDYHGTHCAGTIGARGNNGLLVSGVNWTVKIIPIKFLLPGKGGNSADLVSSLNFVLAQKAKGVNIRATSNSYGGGGASAAEIEAFTKLGAVGILNFCAAGNGDAAGNGVNNDTTPFYPANIDSPYIVSVGASDRADVPAGFSNYGAKTVAIFAPGVDVLSLAGKGGTQLLSGTSMATPCTAGSAALVWSVHPGIGALAMKALLMNSSTKLASLTGKCVSGGRVNVAQALALAGPINGPATPTPTPQPSFILTGTVYSDFSKTTPLSGAVVTLSNGLKTTSDGNGKYTINPVRVGSYTINGAHDGYAFASSLVSGTANQTVPKDLIALPPSSVNLVLNGITRNVLGRNLKSVSVFLNTETVPVAVSGDGGAFKLLNMAPGTYTLSANIQGQVAVAKIAMDASGTLSLAPTGDPSNPTAGRIVGNTVILQPIRSGSGGSASVGASALDPSAPKS